MKNIRFPHNYKRRRTGVKTTVALVAVLALIALALFQPAVLSKTFLSIARPLHLVRQNTVGGATRAFDGLRSKSDLVRENVRLSEELQKAKIKADLFDERRGDFISEDMGTTTSDIVTARVLSSPPFSPYDTLILDAGTESGVSVDDVVSYDDTVALGVIDTVTKKTSRVRLFSSPGVEQSVRIGTHDFLVTARGSGGGTFQLLVLKDELITHGDGVFLPDGRLLARVDTVVWDESDAFALIHAVVPFNLFELREAVITRTR